MKGLDVAKYVVDKCCREGRSLTNLHLQKVLYFVQGEYYQITGNWLIEDDFLAWQYGPVLQSVYDEYSWYYSSRITETYNDISIEGSIRGIIDPIIEERRKKTAGALVEESHRIGGAWYRSYNGLKSTIIPKSLIAEEFTQG